MSVESAGNSSVILVPLSHQVAGHYFGKGRSKLSKYSSKLYNGCGRI